MKFKDHIILILVCTIAWIVFYLIGIPSNYFQTWNHTDQMLLTLITFSALVPLIAFSTIILLNQQYVKTSVWLAFYASVIPLLLDFIVIGILKGYGIHFLISHWYLTVAYVYVWILSPLMGFCVKKLKDNK
jgi:hypothetical protein